MQDTKRELQERLASWRTLAAGSVFSPDSPDPQRQVREHLARRHQLFQELLLDWVADLDGAFAAVERYLEQGERSSLHARYLAERAPYALEVYERALADSYQQAIKNGLQGLPREIITRVYVTPPAPPAPPKDPFLFERIKEAFGK